jgi:hypothetical protein
MDLLLQVGKDELVVKSVFDDFLKTSQPFGLIGQLPVLLVHNGHLVVVNQVPVAVHAVGHNPMGIVNMGGRPPGHHRRFDFMAGRAEFRGGCPYHGVVGHAEQGKGEHDSHAYQNGCDDPFFHAHILVMRGVMVLSSPGQDPNEKKPWQIDSPLVRVKKKCALSLKMLNEDMIFIQI